MLNLVYGTPVKSYNIKDWQTIRVKRDDLAHTGDGPALGKLRGIAHAILASGAEVIGAVDRSPKSRNTWAHAYVCRELGLRFQGYCNGMSINQEKAEELMGVAEKLIVLPGTGIYAKAREHFYEMEPDGWIAEDSCHTPELIDDARDEVLRTGRFALDCGSLVIPVGSGGLAIGVLSGFRALRLSPKVFLHVGSSRRSRDYIWGAMDATGLSRYFDISLVDLGVAGEHGVPFPANVTYEAPAWSWLINNLSSLDRPLFWNAGA